MSQTRGNVVSEVVEGFKKESIQNTTSMNVEINKPPLPIGQWINNPLLLCVNARCSSYIHSNYDKNIAIPLNQVFNCSSDAFEGKAIVRVTNLPSTEEWYFKNRQRKMDFTIQGQFKKRICFDRLYTGQCFEKPFINLPAQCLISSALKVVRTLSPGLKCNIHCENPYIMSPIASAAQIFNVCYPGNETPLPKESKEDMTLVDPKFKNLSASDRKNLMSNMNELQKYYFEPGYIYTFSFYSHQILPYSYVLHLLGMQWDISQYVSSPIVLMAVILSGNKTTNDNSDHMQCIDSAVDDDEDLKLQIQKSLADRQRSLMDEGLDDQHSTLYNYNGNDNENISNDSRPHNEDTPYYKRINEVFGSFCSGLFNNSSNINLKQSESNSHGVQYSFFIDSLM